MKGLGEVLFEVLLVAEVVREDDIEQGPQLQEVVLNGRSGKHHLVHGLYALDHFRRLIPTVFQDVGFIENQEEELFLLERSGQLQQLAVGDQEKVAQLRFQAQFAVNERRLKDVRVEVLFYFCQPMVDDRVRGNNQ